MAWIVVIVLGLRIVNVKIIVGQRGNNSRGWEETLDTAGG